MPVLKRSSDNPDFATCRFVGYPGLWVGAERHAETLAEVERLREALRRVAYLEYEGLHNEALSTIADALDA
jgi:hypothetical protein